MSSLSGSSCTGAFFETLSTFVHQTKPNQIKSSQALPRHKHLFSNFQESGTKLSITTTVVLVVSEIFEG